MYSLAVGRYAEHSPALLLSCLNISVHFLFCHLSGRYFLGVEGPFVAHSTNIITSVGDSSSALTVRFDAHIFCTARFARQDSGSTDAALPPPPIHQITIDGIKGETLTLWAVDPSGELDSKTVTPTSDGPVTVSFS